MTYFSAIKSTYNNLELEHLGKKDLFVILLTLVLAACSILYELVIAHTISLLAANTVVWYSVTVGLFLLGMGLGSIIANPLSRRFSNTGLLISIEILISLLGILIVPIVHAGHMVFMYSDIWGYGVMGMPCFFGVAFLVALLIGILTGLELPLLINLVNFGEKARTAGVMLGVDYLGSLIGALAFPMLLLPFFRMISISLIVASINTLAACLLIYTFKEKSRWIATRSLACLILIFSIFLGFNNTSSIEQYFLQRYYYYQSELSDSLENMFFLDKQFPKIFRKSSPYQKIDLVNERTSDLIDAVIKAYSSKYKNENNFPKKKYLFLNGDYQLHSNVEEVYHEFFAHVPIISSGKVPEKVLVLGGGDGLLIRELVKYPSIKKIFHVDLDPTLIALAKTNPVLRKMNGRSLEDPRVEHHFQDGFQFVRQSKEKFDAIYIDFPVPVDYNLSKLYSKEFYFFVKNALKKRGFATFDATGVGLLTAPDRNGYQEVDSLNDWPYYYHTLKAAGFASIEPYVSSLEPENLKAKKIISNQDQLQTSNIHAFRLLQAAESEEERSIVSNLIFKTAIDSTITEITTSLQQGFIMLANEEALFSKQFWLPEAELYLLNQRRFELAFKTRFPRSSEVDDSKVNSIMRPTFPTTPLWLPRIPY